MHEGCIEQMARLFLDKMAGTVETDEHGFIRMDDWEMADDIQEAVAKNWDIVTSENVSELADIDGLLAGLLQYVWLPDRRRGLQRRCRYYVKESRECLYSIFQSRHFLLLSFIKVSF